MDAITIIDQMIESTLSGGRKHSKPLTGGANQAPFDGEILGRWIRFAILIEIKAEITGEEIDTQKAIDYFNERTRSA